MRRLDSFPNGAYIFDLDGTLFDTEMVWRAAIRRMLKRYGAQYYLELHQRMMGCSEDACIRMMQSAFPDNLPQGEEALPQLREERHRCFREMRVEKGVELMPGVAEFLRTCANERIPLAVATSAKREDALYALNEVRIRRAFRVIVTGDEVQKPKPEPDIYLEAAKQLGVDPNACTAYEDGERGFQSALAAGMTTVFIWDERFHSSPPRDAKHIVRRIDALLA